MKLVIVIHAMVTIVFLGLYVNVSNTKFTPNYNICKPLSMYGNKFTYNKGVRNDNCCIEKYSEDNYLNLYTVENKK